MNPTQLTALLKISIIPLKIIQSENPGFSVKSASAILLPVKEKGQMTFHHSEEGF